MSTNSVTTFLSDARLPEVALFKSNRLYKSKETKQYKLLSVKAYYKGKVLTSGRRPLLKNVFA